MSEIKVLLGKAVAALSDVPGIQAIVLGGSRARKNHTVGSDIDIGIYYDARTLNLSAMNIAAQCVDDMHRESLIMAPGDWGKWVNGGGWLVIDGYPTDFILRDTVRVEKAIEDGQKGVVTAHYQIGHPHAFINVMYMGELSICQILWEKGNQISDLKCVAEQYPDELRKALIHAFSFEAEFSLTLAEKSLKNNDIYYVTAHIVRSISALNQVLFALNREYCLNEKKAVQLINGFDIRPDNYKKKLDSIFITIGSNPEDACRQLKNIIHEVNLQLN